MAARRRRGSTDRPGRDRDIGTWGYIGVVAFATGLLRTCPAYTLLGVNTCGVRR